MLNAKCVGQRKYQHGEGHVGWGLSSKTSQKEARGWNWPSGSRKLWGGQRRILGAHRTRIRLELDTGPYLTKEFHHDSLHPENQPAHENQMSSDLGISQSSASRKKYGSEWLRVETWM